MKNELDQVKKKLKAIDSLSNCIQSLNSKDSKEVAYLIHRIIDAKSIDKTLYEDIAFWKLQANKHLFVKI